VREVSYEKGHVQIFGNNPVVCGKAAGILEQAGATSIDYNLGCSVRKVHKGGGGSLLLKDLDLMKENLKAILDAVSIPVSIKTRIGFFMKDDKSGIEACRIAQDMGCAWATLHGRYAKQGFSGDADWDYIARLVDELEIPVIGNGDVVEPADVVRMFEHTGCAGVMIGRALLGDPWLIGDCERYLIDGSPRPVRSREEQVEIILEHQALLLEKWPPPKGVWEFRKHIGKYLKGFAQASVMRNMIVRCNDPSEVTRMLVEFGKGRPPASIDE
jgi:nifR3 family TIM-barrel protein